MIDKTIVLYIIYVCQMKKLHVMIDIFKIIAIIFNKHDAYFKISLV